MQDLTGLDIALTRLDHDKQIAADVTRVKALQTGALRLWMATCEV